MGLSKNTNMNKHAIKLMKQTQPPYELIYTFSPGELEILKTYIKTHLKTGFIQLSKPPIDAPIPFDKKFDHS